MAKLTLTNLSSLQNEQSAINIINNNNDAIEAAVEKTLSRDGTMPNQMTSELDMNSNRVLNLPQPVSDTEPLRLAELNEFLEGTGDGNVIGPISSTGGNVAVFAGSSGKIIADSGINLSSKANVTSPTISNPTFTGLTNTARTYSTISDGSNITSSLYNNAALGPQLRLGNTGATNGAKTFRINSTGGLETINNAYTQVISSLTDSGDLSINGSYFGNGTTLTGVETSAHAAATYSPITRQYNTQTGTTYTLALSDSGRVVLTTNSSAVTITIPPNSSVAFPLLTQIDFLQYGTGKLTLAQGSGVTIQSNLNFKSILGQFQTATLLKVSTDTWVLFGSLTT